MSTNPMVNSNCNPPDINDHLSRLLQQYQLQQTMNDAVLNELIQQQGLLAAQLWPTNLLLQPTTFNTAQLAGLMQQQNNNDVNSIHGDVGLGVGHNGWQQQFLWQQQQNLLQQLMSTNNGPLPYALTNNVDSNNYGAQLLLQLQQLAMLQSQYVLNRQQILPPLQQQQQQQQQPDADMSVRLAILNSKQSGKKTRLIWTEELNNLFVKVVEELGWKTAVPRDILKRMNVVGLTRENVSSHLQKYRLKRKSGQKLVATVYPKLLNVNKRTGEEDEVNSTFNNTTQKRLKRSSSYNDIACEQKAKMQRTDKDDVEWLTPNMNNSNINVSQEVGNEQPSNEDSSSQYQYQNNTAASPTKQTCC